MFKSSIFNYWLNSIFIFKKNKILIIKNCLYLKNSYYTNRFIYKNFLNNKCLLVSYNFNVSNIMYIYSIDFKYIKTFFKTYKFYFNKKFLIKYNIIIFFNFLLANEDLYKYYNSLSNSTTIVCFKNKLISELILKNKIYYVKNFNFIKVITINFFFLKNLYLFLFVSKITKLIYFKKINLKNNYTKFIIKYF